MKNAKQIIHKVIFILTYMLLSATVSFSQINVDEMMWHQPQSQLYLIEQTRNLLIDAFVQNDKQKVQELHRRLIEDFDNKNYVTLFPNEQILLFAWSSDFENMLQCIHQFDKEYYEQMRKKIMPTRTDYYYHSRTTNNFYPTLLEKVRQESETILDKIQLSILTQEEKDFISIYLHYYLESNENSDVIIRKINADSRHFIETYPQSEYIQLLNSHEYKPANWGWGGGMIFGYAAKTGLFSSHLKNSATVDFNFDVVYKKINLTAGFIFSFGKVREEISKSNEMILPRKTSSTMIIPYLSFGYRFFDDRRIIVTPLAGIGTSWIEFGSDKDRKDNPTLEEFKYSYGLTANFGIMADIRLDKMGKISGHDFAEPTFFAVRLSYKFWYNKLRYVPTIYNGNLHTITAGFTLFERHIKRVKY